MQVTVRSYLTAGVAFVGAGAIAISPISPITPAMQDVRIPTAAVSSAPVELAALVNPIELWATVLATTAGNLGTQAEAFFANPAPILAKIAENGTITATKVAEYLGLGAEGFFTGLGAVPAELQTAAEQILAGEIFIGVQTATLAFLGPIVQAAFGVLFAPGAFEDIPALLENPFLNMANVAGQTLSALVGVGLPFLTFAVSPILQVGLTAQAVYDGIVAGDMEAALNAAISFSSDMVNTIINGSEALSTGGLIGENGVIPGLLGLRDLIAGVIQPPALAPPTASRTSFLLADEVPDVQAETITVGLRSVSETDAGTTELITADGTATGKGAEPPAPTPPPATDEDDSTGDDATGDDETNSPEDGAESEKKTSKREKSASSESRSDRNDTKRAERAERTEKRESKSRSGADSSSSDE